LLYGFYGMKYILALAISFVVTQAYADSWAAAKVAGLVSPTGQVVVRVVPGSNLADVYGFSGSQKGEVAIAIFYRLDAAANYVKYQELPLLNPIAPVFAAVADSGELVTLDNWHNIGTGDAVAVVYASDGKVLRSYRLADIYSEIEIKKFERSVSSISWRCPLTPMLNPRTGALEFMDVLGGNVEISLKTGAINRHPTSQQAC
jgi:hypothetical protein